MTIDELLSAAGLTANDEIPIWDAEATGEPTKKITAQQLATAVGALANLVTGVKGGAENSYRNGNVNLTPANIGAFGVNSVGAITDANDTSLYGSVMLEGSGCANLPSSSSGAFYQVEFFGTYQLASRHTANVGVGEVWARYYANGGWHPWVRIDGVDAVRTDDVANNLTTTEAGKVLDARQGNALNTLIDGLISNTSLGTYSGYAAAAEAVWAAMGNASVKVGKITIEVSGAGSYITVYLAVKSSANYAAVLFVSYSTSLHLAIKISGTATVQNISTTAE